MDRNKTKIAENEEVARILFSPSHIYEGRVSPKAFKLEMLKGGAEDYISVLRYDADELDKVSSFFRLPFHAGIFLTLDGKLQTAYDLSPEIDYFQKELAMLCDGIHKF